MPSPAPNDSSASLVVKSNNEAAVERAVRRWAQQIGARRSEVRRIVWFGSRVNGIPSPASDVDICLVLAHSDKPFRERAADYLPLGFPVGLDLFPYTRAELDCAATTRHGTARSPAAWICCPVADPIPGSAHTHGQRAAWVLVQRAAMSGWPTIIEPTNTPVAAILSEETAAAPGGSSPW